MITINVHPGMTISLGREGENLARKIIFDVSSWQAEYGDGKVSLVANKDGAEPYPCDITVDGSIVTWMITSSDTTQSGFGRCELHYIVGDVLVKSDMWRTYTADALGTPAPEPPEPQQAWVDRVLAAGQAAVDASVNSPKIGSNGNWFVWDFEAGAYVDTGVAASGGSGGGAVSSVNGKTGAVELTAGDVGAVPAPASASVGQTIVVKAVDESGKPTEWESADMAAGGNDWRLIKIITVEEDIGRIGAFTTDDDGNEFSLSAVKVVSDNATLGKSSTATTGSIRVWLSKRSTANDYNNKDILPSNAYIEPAFPASSIGLYAELQKHGCVATVKQNVANGTFTVFERSCYNDVNIERIAFSTGNSNTMFIGAGTTLYVWGIDA